MQRDTTDNRLKQKIYLLCNILLHRLLNGQIGFIINENNMGKGLRHSQGAMQAWKNVTPQVTLLLNNEVLTLYYFMGPDPKHRKKTHSTDGD
jgi:hypothetical protein